MQPLWGKSMAVLQKVGLPHDPAILSLGVCPKGLETGTQTGIAVFVAALFTVARSWKQPKCLEIMAMVT